MIILVRHGEATHHTEHLTGGWTNSDLTGKGREQIEAAATKLARDFSGGMPRFRILCSDLKRAHESAEIFAKKLGIKKVEDFLFLREKNNGKAAGLKESEAKALYLPPATLKELDHRNYPGGETRREFFRRSVDGLHQNADWEKENLIIISHKGTIQNIIFAWLGMDIEDVNRLNYSVDILPSSVTVLGINKWKEHAIFRLNDLSHLQAGEGYGLHKFKLGAIDALFQK
ncbi:MAG: histidine phosphatase family protein [Succiniclasticum sp.]|uniref:histidine phosphatase family protein n=1 Tax=Succiniclasticum sp. TaxID=2775030 RepID=UPI001B03F6FB|nr:histidine phosphatase family protein [Succiniclasticum sp.]MBO5637208.1 histidine phosphatase family protein [Acidaminococcaceae bacterium]MDY6290841.1 histidine phosphatase family protein [Succiniclasticum sp.]